MPGAGQADMRGCVHVGLGVWGGGCTGVLAGCVWDAVLLCELRDRLGPCILGLMGHSVCPWVCVPFSPVGAALRRIGRREVVCACVRVCGGGCLGLRGCVAAP